MSRRVEMADIITFDLEARARGAASLQNMLDISERVAEDNISRILEIWSFPFMPEFGEATEHLVHAEIHRTHVERGQFWLK
ncbi:hypothetical protein M2241_004758 [Bradyrhizobium elkanii]|nr:hypothetical protein [Bradyrhizobium elkanii]MCP1976029.1 hypothetical protein [Bradyrhizobium elkanii]MCS3889454.1 hypothetical protein [Bradyrhizobium elkanii]MCS4211525.1 hypothetical protein [Bradyrhizobium elkanii]MCW2211831.1 hypothetical protein [Bradyrhizobium elkanii]